jgi:hypothetical protein
MKLENNSPTEVFKTCVNARKNGDIEAVKGTLSKETLAIIGEIASTQNKTFDEAFNIVGIKLYGHIPLYEEPSATRKERIAGAIAFIESKNRVSDDFDSFVFRKENGFWKFALDCEVVDEIKTDENIFERLFNYLQTGLRSVFESVKTKS